mmetsp:Transcript_45408/g.107178  ORF Transcript_45408/g.107178 Transcript_45408/m.107178 type:complete len:172 (-) Transcript_45408:70-585(-)
MSSALKNTQRHTRRTPTSKLKAHLDCTRWTPILKNIPWDAVVPDARDSAGRRAASHSRQGGPRQDRQELEALQLQHSALEKELHLLEELTDRVTCDGQLDHLLQFSNSSLTCFSVLRKLTPCCPSEGEVVVRQLRSWLGRVCCTGSGCWRMAVVGREAHPVEEDAAMQANG